MNWTDRQLEAIDSRGSELLVSAAAGSGKTAVLVERIKRLLLEDETDIDRMLVVTFTNAAASEMKEKIGRMLTDALSDPSADPEKSSFLRHQLDILGRANISTFHRFAMDLLRKYYHVTGIDPEIRICEESRQSILMRDSMDELFEERFESKDPDFIHFLDCYAGSKNNDNARSMILSLHSFLQSLPDPESWLERAVKGELFSIDTFKEYAASFAEAELLLICSYLRAAAQILDGAGDGKLPKLGAKHAEDIAAAQAVYDSFKESSENGFKRLSEGIAWQRMNTSKDEKPYYEGVKDAFSALRDKAKKRFADLRADMAGFSPEDLEAEKKLLAAELRPLCLLTADFMRRYAEKKRAGRCLDFSDIEHFSLKILENEEVCAECRERFDYIFIDEYQDSNLVQESLIRRICRPDNVFMVGDVKQSIYKFRLAEPELFLGKYKDIKSGRLALAKAIDLNSNFRSKAPVIDFVNRLFERIMTEDSCGMGYDDDARLVEGAPYEGECLYRPRLYLVGQKMPGDEASVPDEEIAELKRDELEALNAVRVIKEYLGKPIFDSKAGIGRPLGYGDMVILMRSVKNRGEVYYKTLCDAGIPVLLDRSEGYFDVIEIQVFMNLLRLIDNRQKDIPLLSVLRFPSFGFVADELAEIRVWADAEYPPAEGSPRLEYNRAFFLYAEDGRDKELSERCRAFLERLSGWRIRASYLPLGDFLWELLSETGISSFCSALPAGKQRRANLNALVNRAQAYESENAGGLYGFINYIDTISDGKLKINLGQAKISLGNADAVRIMTIHKSKGLEFPFVLVAGLGAKLNSKSQQPDAVFDRDLGAALRLVDPEKNIYAEAPSFRLIKRKKKKEELAEHIRVLYVALTRAKDILVLSGAVSDAEKKLEAAGLSIPGDVSGSTAYLDMILPVIGRGAVTAVYPADLTAETGDVSGRALELKNALENGFEIASPSVPPEEIEKRLSTAYFGEPEEKQKRKYSVSQLAELERAGLEYLPKVLAGDEDGEERREAAGLYMTRRQPAFISGEKVLGGAERGTAYHSVMEHIPFTPEGKTPEAVAAFIKSLEERNILTPAQAKAVDPKRIAAFFASDIGKRVLASSEVHKEAPFVIRKEYMGREILVQGTIDCYFEEDGDIILVDYKSNYVNIKDLEAEMAELKKSYIPQLALYREAIEKILGKKVREALLYLFANGSELRVE